MENDVSEEAINRIVGSFQKKYGKKVDSITALLLNEVFEEKEILIKELKEIKKLHKPLVCTDYKVAFAYGFGNNLWALAIAAVLGLSVTLNHLIQTTNNEYEKNKLVLERYPNLTELEPLIKNAKIIEKANGRFLIISPAINFLRAGNTYIINPSESLPNGSKAILIPLSFK